MTSLAVASTSGARSGGYGVVATGGSGASLGATQRLVAAGVSSCAPKQLASGHRWIGGQTNEIDSKFIGRCSEGSEWGKIVDLNMHFKFLDKIDGLSYYAANLCNLDLSSNNIRQIENLDGMSKLKELKLYGCQIQRIEGLKECPALKSLHLDDNQISTIEGLDHLRFLEYLTLHKNRLSKLGKGLSKLSKLKELHLSQNQLRSLEGLAGLSSLELLAASDNELQELSASHFNGLNKLDELRLANNQLGSFSWLGRFGTTGSSLAPLPGLATLDVSKNQLTSESLKSMPPLPQLIELNLAGNHIEELTGLAGACPALEILDLTGNRLEQVAQVQGLKELVSLQELLLEENPVLQQQEELLIAVEGLPLEYLDDKPAPKPPAPEVLVALGDGEADAEDAGTFALTSTKAFGEAASFSPTKGSPQVSRPGTGSSRPSTAASVMKEAGVRDPLMHCRLRVSERRFATEEQMMQWERNTLSGLAAIDAQVQRTFRQTDSELQEMERFLEKAQKLFHKKEELKRQGIKFDGTLTSLAEAEEAEEAAAAADADSAKPSSRASQRLRSSVVESRGSTPYCEEEPPPPARAIPPPALGADLTGSSTPPVRTPTTPKGQLLLDTCDEEIEEVEETPEASVLDGESEAEEGAQEEEAHEVETEELPRQGGGTGSRGPSREPSREPPSRELSGSPGLNASKELRVDQRASSRDARAGSRDARSGSRDARVAGGVAGTTSGRRQPRRGGSNSRGPPLAPAARAR